MFSIRSTVLTASAALFAASPAAADCQRALDALMNTAEARGAGADTATLIETARMLEDRGRSAACRDVVDVAFDLMDADARAPGDDDDDRVEVVRTAPGEPQPQRRGAGSLDQAVDFTPSFGSQYAGKRVMGENGRILGDVEHVVFNPSESQVEYLVVNLDDYKAFGEDDLRAVPFAFVRKGPRGILVARVAAETVAEGPEFTGLFRDWSEDWAEKNDKYYADKTATGSEPDPSIAEEMAPDDAEGDGQNAANGSDDRGR